jgi:hypothetical protein
LISASSSARNGKPGGATSSRSLLSLRGNRGAFSCVKTWSTPSSASASAALIRAIVPLAMVLDTTTP